MSELKIDEEQFFKNISNYKYFDDEGCLDLELFCFNLSTCFKLDSLSETVPSEEIFDLLLDIFKENPDSRKEENKHWVHKQKFLDWSPDMSFIYPRNYKRRIHVAGMIMVFETWIFNIGYILLRIQEEEKQSMYYYWAKKEWTLTHIFIVGFHHCMMKMFQNTDKTIAKKEGYSPLEALATAKKDNIDYDKSCEKIKRRNTALQEAIDSINSAINEEYYLEAITLQECIISNCLFNYASHMSNKSIPTTLYKLLKIFIKKEIPYLEAKDDLFKNIDIWRKNRNTSLHGYITSRSKNLLKNKEKFKQFSRDTALDGAKLAIEVTEWYEKESANYFDFSPKFNNTSRH